MNLDLFNSGSRLVSALGYLLILIGAWLFSSDRRSIDKRLVLSGVGVQFILGLLMLGSTPGQMFFGWANQAVLRIVQFSNDGAQMVFGEKFRDHFFAFAVLPTIIFFSALMAVLFHLGVMQRVVGVYSWIMQKTMRISGAEATAASAKVFVGGIEASFTIKPYVSSMTRSEIMVLSTTGLATIAGGVMAAYVSLGIDAGHLLSAQLISTVGAVVLAKILVPETGAPKTSSDSAASTVGETRIAVVPESINVFDAACRGAVDGLRVAGIVAGVLIAFVALTSMLNHFLGLLPLLAGEPLSVERALGYLFRPIVYLTGAPGSDCALLATLLGKKVFLNEFLAYIDLAAIRDRLSPRSTMIATYFLCGFGNLSALAMQVGGMSGLYPEQRRSFAELGLRSLVAGTFAGLLSACLAGILSSN